MNRRPPHTRDRDPRAGAGSFSSSREGGSRESGPREGSERTRVPAGSAATGNVGPRRTRVSKNRRKPDILGAVRFLILAVVVAEGLRVAFWSPRLRLQHVQVIGKTRYAEQDLIQQGGIPMKHNIFGVNLARVHDALLKNPVLKAVEVARDFPDGLILTVSERQPALQITGGSHVLHADKEGVVFQTGASLRNDLPVLELASHRVPAVGQRLDPELNAATWECVALARQERVPVRKLRVDGGGELWLNVAIPAPSTTARITSRETAADPVEAPATPPVLPVRLGRYTELPEKFRDVRMVLAGAPEALRAQYLDVMSAGNPAYKPVDRSPSEQQP